MPTSVPTLTPTVLPTLTPTVTANPDPTASFTSTVSAAPVGAVLVNEIYNSGSASWIELYNTSGTTVSLQNWQLITGQATPFYLLIPTTTLSPNGFALFSGTNIPGLGLLPQGGVLQLIDDKGKIRDSATYPAQNNAQSLARIPDGGGMWVLTDHLSPGLPNISPSSFSTLTATPLPTPTPLVTSVSLNEILPLPQTDWNRDGIINAGDAYIELYNSAATSVAISGWQIRNLTGSYTFPIGTTLPATGLLLTFTSVNGLALQASDTVELYAPAERLIERFSYPAVGTDIAWSKVVEGGSSWTTSYPPSPGQLNESMNTGAVNSGSIRSKRQSGPARSLPTFQPKTIGAARLADRMLVAVTGQITVTPGIFGATELYIQDETGGIRVQVALPENLPSLQEGDWVSIAGRIRMRQGEPELFVSFGEEVTFLRSDISLDPLPVKAGELAVHDGQLVTISGTVQLASRSGYLLSDSSGGNVHVVLKRSARLLVDVLPGDSVQITGIAQTNPIHTAIAFLLPRYDSDFSITTPQETPEPGPTTVPPNNPARPAAETVLPRNENGLPSPYRSRKIPSGSGSSVTDSTTATRTPGVIPITDARQLAVGSPVIIRGQVTAPPNTASFDGFYIEDENGGILVVPPSPIGRKTALTLALQAVQEGDFLTIHGTVQSYQGEPAVVLRVADDLSSIENAPALDPTSVTITQLATMPGRFVQSKATLLGMAKNTLLLDTHGTSLIVTSRPHLLDAVIPTLKVGNQISIAGIVQVRHADAESGSKELRLLVRYPEDVIPSDTAPTSGSASGVVTPIIEDISNAPGETAPSPTPLVSSDALPNGTLPNLVHPKLLAFSLVILIMAVVLLSVFLKEKGGVP